MALLELVTEQHAIDEHGNTWKLVHREGTWHRVEDECLTCGAERGEYCDQEGQHEVHD